MHSERILNMNWCKNQKDIQFSLLVFCFRFFKLWRGDDVNYSIRSLLYKQNVFVLYEQMLNCLSRTSLQTELYNRSRFVIDSKSMDNCFDKVGLLFMPVTVLFNSDYTLTQNLSWLHISVIWSSLFHGAPTTLLPNPKKR